MPLEDFVPRYFFDIRDDVLMRDEEGKEFLSSVEAVRYARRILPEIAAHEVRGEGGERQAFTVVVRDAENHPIYSAALSYVGNWLIQ